MTTTTATKWGSSYGIRITKSILEQFPMEDKEKLKVSVDGDKLIFTKVREVKPHRTLEEILIARGWKGETFETEPVIDDFVGREIPLWSKAA